MGRPPIGIRAMTGAERVRRHREQQGDKAARARDRVADGLPPEEPEEPEQPEEADEPVRSRRRRRRRQRPPVAVPAGAKAHLPLPKQQLEARLPPATTPPVVPVTAATKPEVLDDDARKRREVLKAVTHLQTRLMPLIGTQRGRHDIEDAFAFDKGEGEVPDGVAHAALAKAVVAAAEWLPDLAKHMGRRKRRASKADRWRAAVRESVAALEKLQALQDDYASWRGNIPDQLADGQPALIEKLDAVIDLDVGGVIESVEALAEVEFPRGFGKD